MHFFLWEFISCTINKFYWLWLWNIQVVSEFLNILNNVITNNLICTPLSNPLDHWVGMNHQKWNWDQKAFSLSHTDILSSRETSGLTNPAHPTIVPWGLLFHTQMSTILSPRSLQPENWVLYLPGRGPTVWLQAHHSTSPAPVFSSVKWEWIAHIAFSLLYTLPFHAFHNLPTLPTRK